MLTKWSGYERLAALNTLSAMRRKAMIRTCLVTLVLVLAVMTAYAAGDVFDRIDKDGNGKIDKREYREAAGKLFDRLDKNKDGYLDRNEFKAMGVPDSDTLFGKWDVNKDGRISRDEFVKGSTRQFLDLDKNHDRFIDRNEFDSKRNEEGVRKNEMMTTPLVIFRF
jgi:hypothetical protein